MLDSRSKARRFAKTAFILFLLISSFKASAHPFLWKASGEHTFYLFGTIHLPDPRVTDLPEEVIHAMDQSTAVYAELDLSESNIVEIAQLMWLPEEQSLFDFLSVEMQQRLSKLLKHINPGITLEMFSNQKVWALAVTLTLLEQQLKYPGQPPLDIVLFNSAAEQGKITGGLETVHEQMNIFESLSTAEQVRLLNDTVEFMEAFAYEESSVSEKSVNAYLQGDLDQLMKFLTSYMKDEPFYDMLLARLMNDRNIRMTASMLSLVEENPEQTFFFAVGAGHFWGKQGINQLLMDKGYSIQGID